MVAVLINERDLDKILRAEHENPFGILGMHQVEQGSETMLVVRAFLSGARAVAVVKKEDGQTRYAAECIHEGNYSGQQSRGRG